MGKANDLDQQGKACGDANDQVLNLAMAFSGGFERHTVMGTLGVLSDGGRRLFEHIVNLPRIKFFTIGLLLLKININLNRRHCNGVLIR